MYNTKRDQCLMKIARTYRERRRKRGKPPVHFARPFAIAARWMRIFYRED